MSLRGDIVKYSAILLTTILVVGCRTHTVAPSPPSAPTPAAEASPDSLSPLGSKSNPVRGRGPFGEREYLRRLRCPDGAAPTFARRGSVGSGADGHILDLYDVQCPSGGMSANVYMDMYHGDVRERSAVKGFTVLPELPARMATGCPPQVGPTADSSARYVFNYLEVATPVKPLNVPAGPITVGFNAYVSVGFVVDTTGRPEPASLEFGEFVEARERTAAQPIALGLRFTPAEHHPGCLVRQGTGVSLEFR